MSNIVFNYMQTLQKVVQDHADSISSEITSGKTAFDANEKVCREFFKLVQSGDLGFEFNMEIYTYRNRRGTKTSALRTVHSFPRFLADIFNSPEDAGSFNFQRKNFNRPLTNKCSIKNQQILIELYPNLSPTGLKDSESEKFSGRIPEFLNSKLPDKLDELLESGDKVVVGNQPETLLTRETASQLKTLASEIQIRGCCLVASRILNTNDDPDDKLHDLFAIYSKDYAENITNHHFDNPILFAC